jgi:hypothetical protein
LEVAGYPGSAAGGGNETAAKFGESGAGGGALFLIHNAPTIGANAYYSNGRWSYDGANPAAAIGLAGGGFQFLSGGPAAGTAGSAVTFTQQFGVSAAGQVSVGLVAHGAGVDTLCPIAPTGGTTDCACPAGSSVVSGGGWGALGVMLRESRPLSTTTWRISCNAGGTDTPCVGMTLICSRLAP